MYAGGSDDDSDEMSHLVDAQDPRLLSTVARRLWEK